MIRRTVKITFPPEVIDRPIVHSLIKQFDVVVNIREAELEPNRGWLVIELAGELHAVEGALAWARGQGVIVENTP